MKIDYLMKLRKLAFTAGMIIGLSMLTGCGQDDLNSLESGNSSQTENSDKFDTHTYLVIEVGGQTIIFRECDDEIKSVSADYSHSTYYVRYYTYEVIDKDGNVIFNGTTNNEWSMEKINSEYMEEVTRIIEDAAIEKGAILYRGLGK